MHHPLLWTFRPALPLVASLLMAACQRPGETTGSIGEWPVQGAGQVTSLLPAGGDTSVVLVYAPSQCFTCDGELSRWAAVSEKRGWRMHLFLTAEPSAGERDQLRLFRVQPSGVLQNVPARLETPRVYWFAGGTAVDSAVGSPAEHRLLAKAARGE